MEKSTQDEMQRNITPRNGMDNEKEWRKLEEMRAHFTSLAAGNDYPASPSKTKQLLMGMLKSIMF